MSALEPSGGPGPDERPEGAQPPMRTLAEAAKELGALLRQQRTRERAGRDARQLAKLTAQAGRRSRTSSMGVQPADASTPDEEPRP